MTQIISPKRVIAEAPVQPYIWAMRVAFTNAMAITPHLAVSPTVPVTLKMIKPDETSEKSAHAICLSCAEGTHVVCWKDITHCEAVNNYCRIHLSGGKVIFIAKTLKNIEGLLPKNVFLRIHRSHLINMSHLDLIQAGHIVLQNRIFLPVARIRRQYVTNRIKTFCFPKG